MSTIPAERLREGSQILVRGKISFSRLTQLIDGEALARSVVQARNRGAIYPTTTPHTTISLIDAQVVAIDPLNPTTEEQFVQEKIYIAKSGDNAGKSAYSIDSTSPNLPTVLEMDPEHVGQHRQLVLERDLASGLDVTLVLIVFKNGDYAKRGLGLQQVALHEPVRYFSSGVDITALAARGIIVNGPIRTVAGADSTAVAAPFAANGDIAQAQVAPANSQADSNGYPAPAPGALGTVPAPNYAAQAFPQSAPAPQQVQQFQQEVQQAAPAVQQAVAPAASAETPQQQIARLQQQIAEQNAAQIGSGGGSPFDAAPVAVGAPAGTDPWAITGQPNAAYQG